MDRGRPETYPRLPLEVVSGRFAKRWPEVGLECLHLISFRPEVGPGPAPSRKTFRCNRGPSAIVNSGSKIRAVIG